jgi:hypothetical protein
MTDLQRELAECVEALEKATPGKWFVKAGTKYPHLRAKGDKYGDQYIMETGQRSVVLSIHDAHSIARAVNFIRQHHAAIADAVRDAERWRFAAETKSRGDVDYAIVRINWRVGFQESEILNKREADAAIDAEMEDLP